MGKGVSACATCDGFFYKGEDVVVIGGGNTAVEEALYLSNIARKVTARASPQPLSRRGDPGRPAAGEDARRAAMCECCSTTCSTRCWATPRASRRMRVKHAGQRRDARASTVHGVFIAIGHTPNTQLFDGQLEMNNGYIRSRVATRARPPPPAWRAYSPRAMWPTTSIARR